MSQTIARPLLLLFLAACATAAAPVAAPVQAPPKNVSKGLALDGYDPVAYFPEGGGKALKGDKARAVTFEGATYRFASDANRDFFLLNPSHYAPAYGGWCAWAMREGDKVEIDPKSFLVQNDRLLVFYDGFFGDTRKKWREGDAAAYEREADAQWGERGGTNRRDVSAWSLGEGGLALAGRDPMSYFAAGAKAPAAGSGQWESRYRGALYRFASAESRLAFLADPAAHEAAFGGWCALAMASGKQVAADPGVFLLQDGRLLLFADASARSGWDKDAAGNRARAEASWTTVSAVRR